MEQKIVCNFCGKEKNDDYNIYIQGSLTPPTFICEDCVKKAFNFIELSNQTLAALNEVSEKQPQTDVFKLPKPIQIKKFLDDYVIGQDKAKKTLSVAVYNHYKRLMLNDQDEEIQKSNILLIGNTGTGKTLLAQTISKMLDVPFAIADSTALTEAGYVGEDVENILLKLIQNAGNNIQKAERGIIFIDEIDKLADKSAGTSITRDVSGVGVQQALLKIIEGNDVNVPMQGGRKHPNQQYLKINTNNILFILGGAFDGLDKIVQKRINTKTNIGFTNNDMASVNKTSKILTEDLVHYGMIPELLGRVPIIANLNALDEEAMVNILSKPKNSLVSQYQKLLAMDNVELKFTHEGLKEIARIAMRRKLGARGLRSIMEDIMEDIMYEVPNKGADKITINKQYITKKVANL